MYYLGKKLSSDGSLFLFKERLNFTPYIKTKRARFGIKLFQLCTSDGIILDYIMYHGNMATQQVEMKENSLTTDKIPATLMQKYLEKGHHFYIHNYYISIPLAQYFLQSDTYVTGTIRETRKHFPPELKKVTLKGGGSAHFVHDNIIVMKFKAHRDRMN